MENVFIDPSMFNIKKQDEIEKACDFFQKTIILCESRYISVCIYEGLIKRIINRQLHPFPIDINNIADSELKQKLLILNSSFINTVTSNFIRIDVEPCEGEQEFETDRQELEQDSGYYELFCILLRACYDTEVCFKEKVLAADNGCSVKNGDCVEITCQCSLRQYKSKYFWVAPSDFHEASAYFNLKEVLENHDPLYIADPITVRGKHHNKVQSTEIRKFSDIATKNKRVLVLLRYWGLSKVIFQNFTEDASQLTGTIVVESVRDGEGSEIVSGWLYCQTGFKTHIDMYFPIGVGYNLSTCLEKYFSYIKVEHLKTKLGL